MKLGISGPKNRKKYEEEIKILELRGKEGSSGMKETGNSIK